MKIAVSACLLGHNCKYNGSNNQNQMVLDYVTSHEVVPVCPEQLGGLPTPRVPAEIVNGVVTNAEGECVDTQFRRGARRALDIVQRAGVDCAILQPRSPSCGSHQIYDGSFSGTLIDGEGVFAALLREHGIQVLEPDELG
ncbi:MAG: DUF523 domain-containing protein [Eggerthellaceae bacterium]|nr:DUF523 domain-containing protein [Eggerthellaceae bacterium]